MVIVKTYDPIIILYLVPSGNIALTQSNNGTLYTSHSLNLTCVTTFAHYEAVDTQVQVTQWFSNSRGNKINVEVVEVNQLMPALSSIMHITSLHVNDSGTHNCSSMVQPLQQSTAVMPSQVLTATIGINIGI